MYLLSNASLIAADWPAPDNIAAFTTTRLGGHSIAPYQQFNLAEHVHDQPSAVASNRQLLLQSAKGLSRIQWLDQVHGTAIIEADMTTEAMVGLRADASITSVAGLACAVLTADCLPLLVCDRAGHQVAAIHAGWRGLVAGVVEATCAKFKAQNNELLVWFGPAISLSNFEVGEEVRRVFIERAAKSLQQQTSDVFVPNYNKQGHYFADLYQLARIRLNAIGVTNIYGGGLCSFNDSERFYSYRRDGETGRMATLIYKRL